MRTKYSHTSKSIAVKSIFVIAIILSAHCLSFAQTGTEGTTSKATQPGAPAGSYSLSGFENVNLYNGNLNFNLPLVKIGGRGGAQSSVNLSIDSSKWEVERDPTNSVNNTPKVRKLANGVFERYEASEAHAMFCAEIPRPDGSMPNFEDCMTNLEDQTGWPIDNFDLFGAGINTAPGIYYNSYRIRESTMPRAGYGPGIVYARTGRMFNTSLTRLYFLSPNGTEYELRDEVTEGRPIYKGTGTWTSRGQVFSSQDGTGLKFFLASALNDNMAGYIIDEGGLHEGRRVTGMLYFPDGTKYEVNNGEISVIRDVNGNKITYTYDTNHKVTNIVDSLGRQIVITYATSANDPNDANLVYDTIATQKSSTAWQTIKIYRTKLEKVLRSGFDLMTFGSMFPDIEANSSGGTTYNPNNVIKKVELPDGRSYKLFYTPYNEIARIELPTGAAYEYDFPMPSNDNGTIFRALNERRVYVNGGSIATNSSYTSKEQYVRYEPLETTPLGGWGSKVTVNECRGETTDENCVVNTRSDHYFYGVAKSVIHKFYSDWKEAREYKTELFTSDDTLKTRTETEWENLTVAWGDQAVGKRTRMKNTVSTVFEDGQSLASKVEYGYDNTSLTNNKTDERIYDYGVGAPGRLLKHSVTSYLKVNPVNGQDYTGSNIFLPALPETNKLYDVSYTGAETLVSQNEIKYDELPQEGHLANCGITLTGWEDPATAIRGNATRSRIWNSTNNSWIETKSEQDCFGNQIKSWDANNNMFQTEFSSAYLYAFPTKSITPVPDPSGAHGSSQAFQTASEYNLYTGQITKVIDANGQQTITEYDDPLLRPTRATAPNGQQTIFEYGDTVGNLYVKVKKQIDEINWDEATTFFDSLGRGKQKRAKDSQGDVFIDTTYDELGRVEQVSNPYRANETVVWTHNFYDELGRVVKVKTPDNAEVNTAYSLATGGASIGSAVTVTDQALKVRRSITNSLNQLVQVDEPSSTNSLEPLPQGTPAPPPATPTPDPGPPDDTPTCYNSALPNCIAGTSDYPMMSTYYKYDGAGNLKSVIQGEQMREFTYDSLGRLLSAKNPESGTITYAYDNRGNLTNKTDARGITVYYSYDILNRIVSRTYSDSTPSVNFFYDNLVNAKGKLIKLSSIVSTTEYLSFDTMGQVLSHRQTTGVQAFNTSYKYNLSGDLTEETYPSGEVVRNFLRPDGDLDRVAVSGHTYASDFAYAPGGTITSLRLGNGNWESTQLNSRMQPTRIALGKTKDAADLLKLVYDYSSTQNNGNVLSQTITVPNTAQNPGFTAAQTYTYDSLNRLKSAREMIGATETWKQTFAYDRFGNRNFDEENTTTLSKGCLEGNNPTVCANDRKKYNPSVNLSNNRLNADQNYIYDAAGNLLIDAQGRSFAYDADSKQREVKGVNGNTLGIYSYDGDSHRVKKEIPEAETTIFVYDSPGKLIAEYSGQVSQDPKLNHLTRDYLDTPRINTASNGIVTARHDYRPFGEEIIETAARTQILGYVDDHIRSGFTGHEHDAETGLSFAEARMYSNELGRFTTTDPIFIKGNRLLDPQRINLFSYVRNQPLLYTDPTGEDVTIKITNIVVGTQKIRKLQSDGKTYGPAVVVKSYRMIVTNDSGTRRVFQVTRDSSKGQRGSYRADEEAPAGKFTGIIIEDAHKGYRVQLTSEGQDFGKVTSPSQDSFRKEIDIHRNFNDEGAGQSLGCYLFPLRDLNRFTQTMKTMRAQDEENNLGSKINVQVFPRDPQPDGSSPSAGDVDKSQNIRDDFKFGDLDGFSRRIKPPKPSPPQSPPDN